MAEACKLPVNDYGIRLLLSRKEAETLRDVLDTVGGDPQLSRRRYADAIRVALGKAGVCCGPNDRKKTGSYCGVWFNNENETE